MASSAFKNLECALIRRATSPETISSIGAAAASLCDSPRDGAATNSSLAIIWKNAYSTKFSLIRVFIYRARVRFSDTIRQKLMSYPSRNTSQPPHFLSIVRVLVGPGLIIAGVGIIPSSYGLGVVILYFGFVIALAESVYEPMILRLDHRIQIGLIGVTVFFCVLLSVSLVFVNAPISFSALLLPDTDYSPGVGPGNIAWHSFYTELDLIVTNPSEENYDNIDILVRPDYPVAAIGQLSDLSDVSFEDEFGVRNEITMEDGSTHTRLGNMAFIGTDAGYKVHCGHIPPNNSLKIVMAVVDLKYSHPNNHKSSPLTPNDVTLRQRFTNADGTFTYWFGSPANPDLYLPKAQPKKIAVSGAYTASNRRRKLKEEVDVFSGHGGK
jgi:hypothetical protein